MAPMLQRHQAITWASVDPVLCRHMASLGHNELNLQVPVPCISMTALVQSNGLATKRYSYQLPKHMSPVIRPQWIKKTQALVHPDSTFLNEVNSLQKCISYEWKSWKINVHHWYDFLNSTTVKIDEDLWIRVSMYGYSDVYQELGEADIWVSE